MTLPAWSKVKTLWQRKRTKFRMQFIVPVLPNQSQSWNGVVIIAISSHSFPEKFLMWCKSVTKSRTRGRFLQQWAVGGTQKGLSDNGWWWSSYGYWKVTMISSAIFKNCRQSGASERIEYITPTKGSVCVLIPGRKKLKGYFRGGVLFNSFFRNALSILCHL